VHYRIYLADLERRLAAAMRDLREQQTIVGKIEFTPLHEPLRKLLSNGLRMFCWLEDQQNAVKERIAEFLPRKR